LQIVSLSRLRTNPWPAAAALPSFWSFFQDFIGLGHRALRVAAHKHDFAEAVNVPGLKSGDFRHNFLIDADASSKRLIEE